MTAINWDIWMVCIGTYNKSTRKGINKKGINIIWSLVGGDDGGQHWGSLFPSKDWSWLGSDGSGMDGMGDYRGGVGDYWGGVGDHVGRRRGIGFLVSHTLVLHVSDEPVLVVRMIGHNLHPTVRKLDAVFSWGGCSRLVLVCVCSLVHILLIKILLLPWTTP